MQEIIFETKPTLIVETGSACGGSALFFASIFDQVGEGKVISIDIQKGLKPMREHPRVTFLKGVSTDEEVIRKVKIFVEEKRVMVMLDSDHSVENVLNELRIYNRFVTLGCYLIVHDTHLGGNPIINPHSPGNPARAVEIFLSENEQFEPDRQREKFYMTFLPGGWLRRKENKKEV